MRARASRPRGRLVRLLPGPKESPDVSVNGDRRNEEDVPLVKLERGVVVENAKLG